MTRYAYPVLSEGDRGADVLFLQKRLNDWGIQCGTDGDFGPITQKAVVAFQQARQRDTEYANGPLVIDGVVGLQTWAELVKLEAEKLEIQKVTEVVNSGQAAYIFGRTPDRQQMDDLNRCLQRFDITTKARICHFLSQCAHESCGFKFLKELASGAAYEGRRDLGNIHRGDGRKFKGAGVIQLTGRSNYQAFASFVSDQKVVEIGCNYVAEMYPFLSAGFWWSNNRINALCDRGASCAEVSQRVNGKHPANGLAERVYYYGRACQVI